MKEQPHSVPKSEIKWSQENKVEIGPDVDFVYIMRRDGKFTMFPIAQKMATDYQLNEGTTMQTLLEEYDTFFAKLADTFKWGFSSKGNFELHVFDPEQLDKAVRERAQGTPVSLDPLMNKGVYELKVSRGYYLSGRKYFGQVARPVSESLPIQARNIANSLGGLPASISEDDIFSGRSVIVSLNELIDQGVNIHQVIPGIQIGKPKKLSEMGLGVNPAVEYKTTDDSNIFDKVGLGDPRDYLLGASGLVVKLPSGEFGRAPYILPFVSTTARASIPKEIEKQFALEVLKANFEFFQVVQEKTGNPLLLKHTDHSFIVQMWEMYGIVPNTPMDQITTWVTDNIDKLWEITKLQGEFQEN